MNGPVRLALAISFLALLTGAKKAPPNCAPDLQPAAEQLRRRFAAVQPLVTRDGTRATLEWSGIREAIKAKSAQMNEPPAKLHELTVSIYVNGHEEIRGLPWSTTSYTFRNESAGQVDYYVVFKRADSIVHISEFALKETTDGQNITESSFSGNFAGELFNFSLSPQLLQLGVRPKLTASAVRLGNKKVVWILAPGAKAEVRQFIGQASQSVDVHANFGAKGIPSSVLITDRATGRRLQASPGDFFFKVDAAFNGNSFFWDDMLVALATVPYHPWLAQSTLRFWLMVQQRNGGTIPREVRKDNLISLWFPEVIKYGEKPKPNLTFTNPYLMNWVMDELYRFDPSVENTALLNEVAVSVQQYAQWMETHRAVRGRDGKILGFNGSALGSGADNSRGRLGNAHEERAYGTGFVDIIAQQLSMYKDLSRWSKLLAAKSTSSLEKQNHNIIALTAAAKAQALQKTLNERYWNQERGFYFDLIPDGRGGFEQNLEFTPIAGFWPLYAGAPNAAQVERMIQMQLRPEAFGGDFPLPANARYSIIEGIQTDPLYIARDGFRNEDGYWDKWAHWPPMMMVAVEGFRRAGRQDIAYDLTVKLLKKIGQWSEETVEESYGEVVVKLPGGQLSLNARALQHATHPHRPDFAGWGKGPPVYMLLNHFLGLRPLYGRELEWDLKIPMRPGDLVGIKHLSYLGGQIGELTVKKISDDSYELSAETQRPFTLHFKAGNFSRQVKIRAGAHSLRLYSQALSPEDAERIVGNGEAGPQVRRALDYILVAADNNFTARVDTLGQLFTAIRHSHHSTWNFKKSTRPDGSVIFAGDLGFFVLLQRDGRIFKGMMFPDTGRIDSMTEVVAK